jgi:hypothetical protein
MNGLSLVHREYKEQCETTPRISVAQNGAAHVDRLSRWAAWNIAEKTVEQGKFPQPALYDAPRQAESRAYLQLPAATG